jgi:predicted transcriptional regulator
LTCRRSPVQIRSGPPLNFVLTQVSYCLTFYFQVDRDYLLEPVSSKEKTRFQIREFLLKKSASFTQILEICEVDKAAVEKYLKELVDEGQVVLKPKRKQGIEKYALTDAGKDTITLLLEKEKIKTQIDNMTPERFEEFKRFLDFMAKSKTGEEFQLRLSGAGKSEKVKQFKNVGTKNP